MERDYPCLVGGTGLGKERISLCGKVVEGYAAQAKFAWVHIAARYHVCVACFAIADAMRLPNGNDFLVPSDRVYYRVRSWHKTDKVQCFHNHVTPEQAWECQRVKDVKKKRRTLRLYACSGRLGKYRVAVRSRK